MVRIYNHKSSAPPNINTTFIEKYKTHIGNRTRYFTDKGIYELNGNTLRKVIIVDGEVSLIQTKHNDSAFKMIVDTSTENLSEEVYYQIPFGYVRDSVEITSYRLVEHAQPRLVVIRGENGTIADYYVDTTMIPECPDVLETVSTLLMAL